jgi:nicotinamidase-related amidase
MEMREFGGTGIRASGGRDAPRRFAGRKPHHGAFARTELESLLNTHGVDTVVICGISTSVGVEATAPQGTGLVFAFVVVEDACGAMVVEERIDRHSLTKLPRTRAVSG